MMAPFTLLFWLAWVLDFGPAIGLPELGFWAIVLATLFLVVGWFPKLVITAIVFLVDPSWFHGAARVHWPEPTFRNFVGRRAPRGTRVDLMHTRTKGGGGTRAERSRRARRAREEGPAETDPSSGATT
jgi:hypothetical protein